VAAPRAGITLRWKEKLVFTGAGKSGQPTLADGNTEVATSPVEMLLVAVASCTASDVVLILEKMRVTLRELEVRAEGDRRETEPRRFTAIQLHFRIVGDDLDETKARRAIALSIEKYCSVIASLATDIPVTYDVVLA
jgi:putative redox protein